MALTVHPAKYYITLMLLVLYMTPSNTFHLPFGVLEPSRAEDVQPRGNHQKTLKSIQQENVTDSQHKQTLNIFQGNSSMNVTGNLDNQTIKYPQGNSSTSGIQRQQKTIFLDGNSSLDSTDRHWKQSTDYLQGNSTMDDRSRHRQQLIDPLQSNSSLNGSRTHQEQPSNLLKGSSIMDTDQASHRLNIYQDTLTNNTNPLNAAIKNPKMFESTENSQQIDIRRRQNSVPGTNGNDFLKSDQEKIGLDSKQGAFLPQDAPIIRERKDTIPKKEPAIATYKTDIKKKDMDKPKKFLTLEQRIAAWLLQQKQDEEWALSKEAETRFRPDSSDTIDKAKAFVGPDGFDIRNKGFDLTGNKMDPAVQFKPSNTGEYTSLVHKSEVSFSDKNSDGTYLKPKNLKVQKLETDVVFLDTSNIPKYLLYDDVERTETSRIEKDIKTKGTDNSDRESIVKSEEIDISGKENVAKIQETDTSKKEKVDKNQRTDVRSNVKDAGNETIYSNSKAKDAKQHAVHTSGNTKDATIQETHTSGVIGKNVKIQETDTSDNEKPDKHQAHDNPVKETRDFKKEGKVYDYYYESDRPQVPGSTSKHYDYYDKGDTNRESTIFYDQDKQKSKDILKAKQEATVSRHREIEHHIGSFHTVENFIEENAPAHRNGLARKKPKTNSENSKDISSEVIVSAFKARVTRIEGHDGGHTMAAEEIPEKAYSHVEGVAKEDMGSPDNKGQDKGLTSKESNRRNEKDDSSTEKNINILVKSSEKVVAEVQGDAGESQSKVGGDAAESLSKVGGLSDVNLNEKADVNNEMTDKNQRQGSSEADKSGVDEDTFKDTVNIDETIKAAFQVKIPEEVISHDEPVTTAPENEQNQEEPTQILQSATDTVSSNSEDSPDSSEDSISPEPSLQQKDVKASVEARHAIAQPEAYLATWTSAVWKNGSEHQKKSMVEVLPSATHKELKANTDTTNHNAENDRTEFLTNANKTNSKEDSLRSTIGEKKLILLGGNSTDISKHNISRDINMTMKSSSNDTTSHNTNISNARTSSESKTSKGKSNTNQEKMPVKLTVPENTERASSSKKAVTERTDYAQVHAQPSLSDDFHKARQNNKTATPSTNARHTPPQSNSVNITNVRHIPPQSNSMNITNVRHISFQSNSVNITNVNNTKESADKRSPDEPGRQNPESKDIVNGRQINSQVNVSIEADRRELSNLTNQSFSREDQPVTEIKQVPNLYRSRLESADGSVPGNLTDIHTVTSKISVSPSHVSQAKLLQAQRSSNDSVTRHQDQHQHEYDNTSSSRATNHGSLISESRAASNNQSETKTNTLVKNEQTAQSRTSSPKNTLSSPTSSNISATSRVSKNISASGGQDDFQVKHSLQLLPDSKVDILIPKTTDYSHNRASSSTTEQSKGKPSLNKTVGQSPSGDGHASEEASPVKSSSILNLTSVNNRHTTTNQSKNANILLKDELYIINNSTNGIHRHDNFKTSNSSAGINTARKLLSVAETEVRDNVQNKPSSSHSAHKPSVIATSSRNLNTAASTSANRSGSHVLQKTNDSLEIRKENITSVAEHGHNVSANSSLIDVEHVNITNFPVIQDSSGRHGNASTVFFGPKIVGNLPSENQENISKNQNMSNSHNIGNKITHGSNRVAGSVVKTSPLVIGTSNTSVKKETSQRTTSVPIASKEVGLQPEVMANERQYQSKIQSQKFKPQLQSRDVVEVNTTDSLNSESDNNDQADSGEVNESDQEEQTKDSPQSISSSGGEIIISNSNNNSGDNEADNNNDQHTGEQSNTNSNDGTETDDNNNGRSDNSNTDINPDNIENINNDTDNISANNKDTALLSAEVIKLQNPDDDKVSPQTSDQRKSGFVQDTSVQVEAVDVEADLLVFKNLTAPANEAENSRGNQRRTNEADDDSQAVDSQNVDNIRLVTTDAETVTLQNDADAKSDDVNEDFPKNNETSSKVPEISPYRVQDFSLLKPTSDKKTPKDSKGNDKNRSKTTTTTTINTSSTINMTGNSRTGIKEDGGNISGSHAECEDGCSQGAALSSQRAQAAVSAVLTTHFGPTKDQIIPFDLELLDLADNYDNTTGVFICTLPGTYVISLYLMSHPGAKVNARVLINNRPIAALWADDSKNAGFYPSSSTQTIAQLAFGDQVYVMLVDGGYGDSWVHANYNVFTIFLLYEQMF